MNILDKDIEELRPKHNIKIISLKMMRFLWDLCQRHYDRGYRAGYNRGLNDSNKANE